MGSRDDSRLSRPGSCGPGPPRSWHWPPTEAESGSSKRKLYLCSKSSCFFRNSSPSSEESSTASWTGGPGTLRDEMGWDWGCQPSSCTPAYQHINSFNPHKNPLLGCHHYPHFIDGKTEAWKSSGRAPWLQSPHSAAFPQERLTLGNSLVVQWLRLTLPLQGPQVQSLVGELRSCMPHSAAKKKKKRRERLTLLPSM